MSQARPLPGRSGIATCPSATANGSARMALAQSTYSSQWQGGAAAPDRLLDRERLVVVDGQRDVDGKALAHRAHRREVALERGVTEAQLHRANFAHSSAGATRSPFATRSISPSMPAIAAAAGGT